MISIAKYGGRNWAIYFNGELLAVTVYKKGAYAIAAVLRGFLAKGNTVACHTVNPEIHAV